MASVTAVTFEDMEQGPKVREALKDPEKQGLLSLDDAAVIVRDKTANSRFMGRWIGASRSGPVPARLSAFCSARSSSPSAASCWARLAVAGIGASTKIGIEKKFIQDVEAAMPNGSSAIIIYVRAGNPSAVRPRSSLSTARSSRRL